MTRPGATPAPSPDRPLWCDGADFDLPNLLHGARALLGDVAGLTVWTTCRRPVLGALFSPCVWLRSGRAIAYYGLELPARPPGYWTDAPPMAASLWEAVRVAWAQQHSLALNLSLVLSANDLWAPFDVLLGEARGIAPSRGACGRSPEIARAELTRTLQGMARAVGLIVEGRAACRGR